MGVRDRLQPELVADAERILDESGHPHSDVIEVTPDAILYLNSLGKPRTLWIRRQEGTGRLRTQGVEGFPPWPPEGWA